MALNLEILKSFHIEGIEADGGTKKKAIKIEGLDGLDAPDEDATVDMDKVHPFTRANPH